MWKVKYNFTYTGQPQQFHLNASEYLCICKGAHGGGVNVPQNCGGTSYGILNLATPLTAYAVVGGVGGDDIVGSAGNPGTNGDGGYNGGGRGGLSCDPETYKCGSGGGGASDIRLSNDGDQEITIPHQVPDEYDEVEYIESDRTQYINLGVNHTADTRIECVCEVIQNTENGYEVLFGSRASTVSRSLALFTRFDSQNIPCYSRGDTEYRGTGMVYDQKIKIIVNGDTVSWYDMSDTLLGSVTNTATQVDGTQPMYLFDLNDAGSPGGLKTRVKISSFKMYNNDQLVRYMVPFNDSGTEIDTSSLIFEQGTIDSNGDDMSSNSRIRTIGYIPYPEDKYYTQIYATGSSTLMVNIMTYNNEGTVIDDMGWVPSGDISHVNPNTSRIRICIRRSDQGSISPADLSSINIKVFKTGTNTGMYDLANDKIYTKATGNDFIVGNPVQTKTIYNETKSIDTGLYSRIMVAGGGGGASLIFGDSYSDFTGFGGGVYGGYPCTKDGYDNNNMCPDQTSGYSFGEGQDAPDRNPSRSPATYGAQGIGGGGGGWFGGYSSNEPNPTKTESACNGGGGSGYILTSTSYKPFGYMTGIIPRDDLNFTGTLMTSGSAYDPCVMILEPTTAYTDGDTLICECIGSGTEFDLYSGTYTVECYGGCGGSRSKRSTMGAGGYAKGTFSNPVEQKAYAYVGGPAIYAGSVKTASFQQSTHPTLLFNGGGAPSGYGDVKISAEAAGGATDLRIGTDSLYSRIIVAGGAGGMGRVSSSGGAGGGTEGGLYTGSGYGTNAGVGGQSSGGGSFGYGGDGASRNNGYGGAGGGGWFGGGGTTPDGSGDDDLGGCGGSGYVLTESSWKPENYLLDESYYMTDTTLTRGGNTTLWYTGLIIHCDSVNLCDILCHDSEGYKSYDTQTHSWVFLKTETPSTNDFEEYGVASFATDTGLLKPYDIYIRDKVGLVNSITINGYPGTQHVKMRYKTDLTLSSMNIDADVDDTAVTFDVDAKRKGVAEDVYIYFDMSYTFTRKPSIGTRMYCIQGYTKGSGIRNSGPPQPKPKTIDKIDLLPVGLGNRMPARYKNYIGGFIDGSTAITSTNSAVVCEHNRCIYSATLCNNTVVRFAKLNLVTNTSYIIKDIPKSRLGSTYYGDIKVDDSFIYITSSDNNNKRVLWRTPNSSDTTVTSYTMPDSNDYNINAYGKMEWYNDHTLIMVYRRGFVLFDTETHSFSYKASPSQNDARGDMAIGTKYALSFSNSDSNSAWVCELATNTWSELGSINPLSGKYVSNVCHHNGVFYVVQRSRLHFIDGETLHITYSVATPFTDIDTKSINYADGVLYITLKGSPTLYIYDITNDRFTSTGLSFKMDERSANGWIRPCAFRGYCFIPQIKLYTINYVERAKYSLGYKYDQFIVVTNLENAEDPDNMYEYDPKYVTFTTDNMYIHDGGTTLPFSIVDPTNNIKKCTVTSDLYNVFVSSKINAGYTDDGDTE